MSQTRISLTALCLALAVSLAGCRGEDEPDPVASAVAYNARESDRPAPRVGQEFQQAVARLRSEGLKLVEAAEAGSKDGPSHLAAIFEREKPAQPNEAYELRILESDGGAARTIFRRAEFFFSFTTAGEFSRFNLTDLTGDGAKEVVVQSSSGGNCWSCNPTEIYSIKGHKAELIAASPLQDISDLDGDSVPELVAADARWEFYGELSHAASPSSPVVYRWRDGRYVYASREFPDFYRREAERLRASIEGAKADISQAEFSDDAYVGLSVSLALAHAHMGEAERGLKELEALLGSNAKSPAQVRRRAGILKDFRSGEAAARLREMKHGDPMPLG